MPSTSSLREIAVPSNGARGPVRFAIGLLAKLRRYAAAAAPREICGIVIAERRLYGLRIRDVKLVPNIASNPVARFEISPQRLRALVPPVSSGLMWGLFHSHTLTDAQPSRADLFALKNYGKVHVILSTQGEIRVFLSGSSDSHQT